MRAHLNGFLRCQVPPILLAVLLQMAPAIHWFTQQMTQPGGLIAIVVKIGGISAALLGGTQAMSGATTWVSSTNPPAGGVGIAYQYRLQTSGDNLPMSWSATNLPPGLSIQSSVVSGIMVFFAKGTPTLAGTFKASLTAWQLPNQGGASAWDYATFVITNVTSSAVAPGIGTAPQTQRRIPGTNATFSVTANGTSPLAYQWRRFGTNLTGETRSLLLLTNLSDASAGTYAVVVTNSAGSVTSAPATLLIAKLPTITNSIASPGIRMAFYGETGVTYRLEFSGIADSINWNAATNITPTEDAPITLTNSPSPGTNTFFRLRLLSP